jgi:pilin isopeptide linkage protein
MAVIVADVQVMMSKIAVGVALEGGEFSFGLFNAAGQRMFTATNDKHGVIDFPHVQFSAPGVYNYSAREISAPEGWEIDASHFPVVFDVFESWDDTLKVAVSYPNGAPVFKNTMRCNGCGLVEFPELFFDAPGIYKYTMKELSPDGGGWETDKNDVPVIVEVIDDGHGNLIAAIHYPDGFPNFVNYYRQKPARTILSACKMAVGANLPEGRFEFGLYDEHGDLISIARNGPAVQMAL